MGKKKNIQESFVDEERKDRFIPSALRTTFKNRVVNAFHMDPSSVEKVVKEFFVKFKDRVPNNDFNMDNLMNYAEDIIGNIGSEHGRPGMHMDGFAEKWWGSNMEKSLEEGKNVVKLTESDLKRMVNESVRKVLMEMHTNELRSSTYANAVKKMRKYAMYGDEKGKFGKDEYGNPLYKDGKTVASHLRNLGNAYNDAKQREDLEDPIVQKAQELYDGLSQSDFDIDVFDRVDTYSYEVGLYAEVEDENGGVWNFSGSAMAERAGGWEISEIEEMEFTAPDGTTGDIPRP